MRRKAFSKFSAVIIVPPPDKEGARKRRGVGGGVGVLLELRHLVGRRVGCIGVMSCLFL